MTHGDREGGRGGAGAGPGRTEGPSPAQTFRHQAATFHKGLQGSQGCLPSDLLWGREQAGERVWKHHFSCGLLAGISPSSLATWRSGGVIGV